ncbi:MAG: acetate--CoA ligase [Chloroflexi bacterium]|nr:acetate--CoA ligase [Chloroflexota bacterium]
MAEQAMEERRPASILPPHVRAFYRKAEENYDDFWEEAALNAVHDIHWFRRWDKVFEHNYPTFKWYIGGRTNICYSALDYKVMMGKGAKAAYIAESGDTGEIRAVTYIQLLNLVKHYSAALRGIGVEKGDRIAIYMPMGIESAGMMLACARIGAIHVVIFAGFSPRAIADRVELSGAKYVICKARGSRRGKPVQLKEMVDDALGRLPDGHGFRNTVVLDAPEDKDIPMKPERDILWKEFLAKAEGQSGDYVEMESNEPLFLLPTSGTTARPKVSVQNHGGYQVYIYSMAKWIYNLNADDIWFSTSDIGWIVGHSYNIYAPLLYGCTSVLYEGTPDYPRNDMWYDLIERNRVTGIFTSPTGIRGLARFGVEPARKHNLSSVQRVVCAGEVLNPAAWKWFQEEVFEGKIPVIDHMWQTETSGAIIGNPYGLGMAPIKPGSAAFPTPGVIADIVDEKDGRTLGTGEKGILVIKKPFPGLTPALWGDPERYKTDYWEARPGTKGMYYAGDAAARDEDGYIWFAGRADEVMKIAAHRIGTIEVENALVSHPAVVEAAVTGVPDELRGEVASAFVVLNKNYQPSEELKKELMNHVRKEMGAIIVMKDIGFLNMLPKTRSGKIMRRVIKALLTNKELGDLSTIEEEASVDEIREAISKIGKI